MPSGERHTFFGTRVAVREWGWYWDLIEVLEYKGNEDHWVIPIGFRTDFGSIPRLLRWLVRSTGLANRPFVLHDYLDRRHDVSNIDADRILRRVMREAEGPNGEKLPEWEIRLTYAGVRLGDYLGMRRHPRMNARTK